MKYVKMLGLTAVAAAAVMAFVGSSTASATVLCKVEGTGEPTGTTCPANQAYPAGTEIHAVAEGTTTLTTSFKNIECEESTVSGKTNNEGSPTETVSGPVEILTFGKCNCEVKVLKKGTLEIHWPGIDTVKTENGEEHKIETGHNGTLTSSGAEVTTECSSVFGKVHCIYVTNNTDLGLLTGSATTKSTATMDIESAGIPVKETNPLCPEKSKWDAKYSVTTPDALNVAGHT